MALPNTYYVPVIQTPYIFQALIENEKWAALMASGVLDTTVFADVEELRNGKVPGDAVNIPQFNQAADFVELDITDDTDATFTQISSSDMKVPIIRRISPNMYTRPDQIRAGEDFRASFEHTAGNKLAKEFIKVMGLSLSGALDSTTPSHVQDSTGSKLSIEILSAARAKLGDIGMSSLHTLVASSQVLFDLYKDLVTTFKYNAPMAQFLVDGNIKNLLGIKDFIMTDLMPVTPAGFSSSGDDVYESFLLGDGAVWFAYQDDPEIEYFSNVPKAVTQHLVKINADYVCAPRGFGYTGSTGSVLYTDLSNSGNWDQKVENHRNIRAVKIKTSGFGGV